MRRLMVIALGGVFLFWGGAQAQTTIPGGGSPKSDCLLEFAGVTPTRPGGRIVRCSDGDPNCDADGMVDQKCTFEVTACLNNADPTLPACLASGVESVRVRTRGADPSGLQAALDVFLPTSQNACTTPQQIVVPVRAHAKELGTRHFSIDPAASSFSIGPLFGPVASFTGYLDLRAGAPDPVTGLAVVDVVGASDYISAYIGLAGTALCIKPVLPAINAGLISCATPGAALLRFTTVGNGVVDRDSLALICDPQVDYSSELTQDHNIGVVGENGFTSQDCENAGGHVEVPSEPHPNVCNGPFEISIGGHPDNHPGAMFIAPIGQVPGVSEPLIGLGVEITQETALPCGDEGGTGGISTPIALTTGHAAGRILHPNNNLSANPLEYAIDGEDFSCRDFAQEDGPGGLAFVAPQFHLPFVNDAITGFQFFDSTPQ